MQDQRTAASSQPPPAAPSTATPSLPIPTSAQTIHELLVKLLNVQVDPQTASSTTKSLANRKRTTSSPKATEPLFLRDLAEQFKQGGEQRGQHPLLFTAEDVDQIICTRLQLGVVKESSVAAEESPLGWLLCSLTRVQQMKDGRHSVGGIALETMHKTCQVLSNYLLTMVSIPGFADSLPPHEDTVAELTHRIVHSQGTDADRGTTLAIKYMCMNGQEGGFEALRSMLHSIVLGDQSLLNNNNNHNSPASTVSPVIVPMRDTGPYLAVQNAVMNVCMANKNAVGGVLMESMSWSNGFPITTGAQMEHCTLLGVLLRIGVSCLPCVPPELFSPPSSEQQSNAFYQQQQQQLQLRQMQWSMTASGTKPAHVSSETDPPIARFQVRAQLLRQPQFQIGPSDVIVAARDFPWPNRVSLNDYSTSKQRIHGTLTPVWDNLHRLVHAALKIKTQRTKMVQWLARALALQAGRDKSHRNQFREASDSFSLNLFAVLLRLCDPIMKLELDGSWPLLSKVQSHEFFQLGKDGKRGGKTAEFLSAPGVYLGDTPWLRDLGNDANEGGGEGSGGGGSGSGGGGGSGSTTNSNENNPPTKAVNFPTQCFFLTSRSLHLSFIKMLSAQKNLQRMAQQYASSSPAMAQGAMSVWLVRRVQLSNPDLLRRTVQFSSFTSSWILRAIGHTGTAWVDPNGCAASAHALSHVPQHMVEDLVGVMDFLSLDADVIQSIHSLVPGHVNLCGSIIRCLVALLSGGKSCVSSPHVRAKIGDIIHQCFFSQYEQRQDIFPILPLSLFSSPFYVSILLPSLLQLYGDVEPTGFYLTVQHRGKLTVVIKHLLSDPNHRNALLSRVADQAADRVDASEMKSGEGATATTTVTQAPSQNEFNFISTANGLMNQANSAITDGLSHLELVKKHQDVVKNVAVWQAQTEAERKEAEEQYANNEGTAKHYLNTAMQALDLLVVITSHMRAPFMHQILLGRLSSTLTSLLRKLIESQTSLKVDNPEKYGFNAKEMLQKVVATCLNMYGKNDGGEQKNGEQNNHDHRVQFCASFATPFVEDFHVKMLDRATKILKKYNILPANDFTTWVRFVEAVKTEVQTQISEEELLGEVPEEFECEMMCTIMQDPVKLPGCKFAKICFFFFLLLKNLDYN